MSEEIAGEELLAGRELPQAPALPSTDTENEDEVAVRTEEPGEERPVETDCG